MAGLSETVAREDMGVEAALAHKIAAGIAIDFEAEALAVFAYQFERNSPYRAYCLRRGRTPANVSTWRDIPAVGTTAFTVADLACGPPERVFRTSGTTRGPESRGRHLVPHLPLYRAAALAHFAAVVAADTAPMPVLALTPPPAARPDSSLLQMIEWIAAAYGTGAPRYSCGPRGPDIVALARDLEDAVAAGTPIYLIGLTPAIEQLFTHWHGAGLRVRLPYGSRVIDTGGHKGAATADAPGQRLSRAGFLAACWRFLNVPGYHCINEYGMTELCSQFYDNVLVTRRLGHLGPRHLIGPPWTRTLVVDPETLAEVPEGTVGLLRHFDLANCGSVLAVQTEDLGSAVGDGFLLHGRATGAEPRGCALLLDEFADANADCDVLPARMR
jgi:hypothetical protein